MTTESKSVNEPYRIVVGFDFSELSERAFEEALDIARHRAPAELHVLTAAPEAGLLVHLPGNAKPISDELARETVRLRLARVVDDNQALHGPVGLERIAVYVVTGARAETPAKLITELATSVEASLIVVGTHGRKGLARMLLGSVAAQVVREATTSVQVVRPSDFVRGEKVPVIQAPLAPGEPHLKHFVHRRIYHYIDRIAAAPSRTMPVS